MLEYLLNHLIEILAIFIAVITFLLQRNRKEISYTSLINTNLIFVSDQLKDEIEIKYKNEKINELQLIEVKIENSGNLAIKPNDFIQPLEINFPQTLRILSSTVIDQASLGVLIMPELSTQSSIVLSDVLLNPKDNFKIKVLLDGAPKDFSVDGRIVGVQKISRRINNTYEKYFLMAAVTAVVITIGVTFAYKSNLMTKNVSITILITLAIFWILYTTKLFRSIWQDRNTKY